MTPDRRYGFPAKVRLQLSGWAGRQPLVGRVWLFGSRVRGDHRPDSDLDVAIELDLPADPAGDDGLHPAAAVWMYDTEGWAEELRALTGLVIDLQHLDGHHSPTIQAGVAEAGLLVYCKRR